MEVEFQKQLDFMVQKSKEIEGSQATKEITEDDKHVASHFTLTVPLVELLVVNK